MPVIVSPEQFCEELIRDVPFSQALVNTFDRYARGPKPYEDDLGRGRGLVGQTESGYALRLNHERGYNPFESTELLLCADDSEKSSMDERILQHYLSNLVRVSFAYSNKGQGSININGTHIKIDPCRSVFYDDVDGLRTCVVAASKETLYSLKKD